MRRRTQAEMDQLVEAAGFRKIDAAHRRVGHLHGLAGACAPAPMKPARGPRPWKRAAAWLALLGPLFYATYGFANWWAATRAHVPALVFDWERDVPFWPWTIFPYWTINAFYALSLFLARDRHDARPPCGAAADGAGRRGQPASSLWPLRFTFGQPAVEGAPAFLFDALRGFDQPFNQAPSLHIALAVILWDWYRRLLHARWARARAARLGLRDLRLGAHDLAAPLHRHPDRRAAGPGLRLALAAGARAADAARLAARARSAALEAGRASTRPARCSSSPRRSACGGAALWLMLAGRCRWRWWR